MYLHRMFATNWNFIPPVKCVSCSKLDLDRSKCKTEHKKLLGGKTTFLVFSQEVVMRSCLIYICIHFRLHLFRALSRIYSLCLLVLVRIMKQNLFHIIFWPKSMSKFKILIQFLQYLKYSADYIDVTSPIGRIIFITN